MLDPQQRFYNNLSPLSNPTGPPFLNRTQRLRKSHLSQTKHIVTCRRRIYCVRTTKRYRFSYKWSS
jgi:hypothetical protein